MKYKSRHNENDSYITQIHNKMTDVSVKFYTFSRNTFNASFKLQVSIFWNGYIILLYEFC